MKLKNKILIDAILFLLLIVCMKYDFTGGLLHEILGVLLLIGFFLHVYRRRKYYSVILKQMKNKANLTTRARISAILNYVLLLAGLLMAVSSLAISQDLLPVISNQLTNYPFWRNLHIASAVILLLCVFAHACLHAGVIHNYIKKQYENEKVQQVAHMGARVLALFMAVIIAKTSYENTLQIIDDISRNDYANVETQEYLADPETDSVEDSEANSAKDSEVDSESPANSAGVASSSDDSSSDDSNASGNSSSDSNSSKSKARPERPSEKDSVEIVKQDDSSEEEIAATTTDSSSDDMTLEEYLSSLTCTACGKHCSLASPRCGRSSSQIEKATQEYNEIYGA